jgi:hypothetical protein
MRAKVFDKAARDAEAKLPAALRKEGPQRWRLRCSGAYVEAEAFRYETRSPSGERRKQEHAEQLWAFVTRASQTVKREYKGNWDNRWPGERVGLLTLDDLLADFRERYSVGDVPADEAHAALAGAWEVPFPELRDYLPIVPHEPQLRVITSTRGGAALLCRYEHSPSAATDSFTDEPTVVDTRSSRAGAHSTRLPAVVAHTEVTG